MWGVVIASEAYGAEIKVRRMMDRGYQTKVKRRGQ